MSEQIYLESKKQHDFERAEFTDNMEKFNKSVEFLNVVRTIQHVRSCVASWN